MTDRLSALMSEAQQETNRNRPDWAKYAPIVRVLRQKEFSYQQAYQWLIERGEPLNPSPIMFNRFRAAISVMESKSGRANLKAAQKAKGGQS